jgi:hypothetical protein
MANIIEQYASLVFIRGYIRQMAEDNVHTDPKENRKKQVALLKVCNRLDDHLMKMAIERQEEFFINPPAEGSDDDDLALGELRQANVKIDALTLVVKELVCRVFPTHDSDALPDQAPPSAPVSEVAPVPSEETPTVIATPIKMGAPSNVEITEVNAPEEKVSIFTAPLQTSKIIMEEKHYKELCEWLEEDIKEDIKRSGLVKMESDSKDTLKSIEVAPLVEQEQIVPIIEMEPQSTDVEASDVIASIAPVPQPESVPCAADTVPEALAPEAPSTPPNTTVDTKKRNNKVKKASGKPGRPKKV